MWRVRTVHKRRHEASGGGIPGAQNRLSRLAIRPAQRKGLAPRASGPRRHKTAELPRQAPPAVARWRVLSRGSRRWSPGPSWWCQCQQSPSCWWCHPSGSSPAQHGGRGRQGVRDNTRGEEDSIVCAAASAAACRRLLCVVQATQHIRGAGGAARRATPTLGPPSAAIPARGAPWRRAWRPRCCCRQRRGCP